MTERRYTGGGTATAQADATTAIAAASSAQATASAAVAKAVGVFDQTANSTTLAVVPAAVNVGALTLLTDAITAIGTLQTAINANRQLTNRLINIVRGAG